MKIVDICERTVPIATTVRNARVDFSEITATILAIKTDQFRDGKRVVGYAFNSFGRYACGGPLRERLIPRLMRADPGELIDPQTGFLDPDRCSALLLRREKAGAHAERSMAMGTLELACWDIAAKMRGLPLYRLIGEHFGVSAAAQLQTVPCYAGGGFYNEVDDREKLHSEINGFLESGYTHVKIKAGGLPLDQDLRRIESVLELVGQGSALALDASCAFDRREALAYAKAIDHLGLRWLEEPCDPADFEGYRDVSMQYSGNVAGGENLFSLSETENFLRYGEFGGKIVLQPDPPLAYGVTEFERIVQTAAKYGVDRKNIMPHGGNMMSLHVTAGLDLGSAESYPGLFGAFAGFSNEVKVIGGKATLPTSPGIGFEEQPALFNLLSEL